MDMLNEWLMRSGRGDARAFQQLYQAASPRLYAICKRLLHDHQLAEDVLQESFIKIWHAASQFSMGKASAMTWMVTIVRHQAIDRLRAERLQRQNLDDSVEYETLEFATLEPSPEAIQQLDEEGQRLMTCLEHLSADQRQCVLAAYYEGRTHAELAEVLAKPLGTIKAWIRRGLMQLRECLQ